MHLGKYLRVGLLDGLVRVCKFYNKVSDFPKVAVPFCIPTGSVCSIQFDILKFE